MDSGSSQLERGGPLGRWILAPFAVLFVLAVLAYLLPQAPVCETENDGFTARESVLLAICVLASLGFVVAALRRFAALARSGRIRPGVGYVIVTVPIALLVLSFVLSEGEDLFASTIGIGLPLTGIALLVLVGAWIGRRRVEDVGVLLPLYLTGAGVFCFPFVGLFLLVVGSGALCG